MNDRQHLGLCKNERLCRKKIIDNLFQRGNFFIDFPFRVVWSINNFENPYPAQIGISVSKRFIKKAVKRNLIKRRIREAYRKNKHLLYHFLSEYSLNIVFMIIYLEKQPLDYQLIENKLSGTLVRLCKEINNSNKKA
jgi:ribonuclease P protein component